MSYSEERWAFNEYRKALKKNYKLRSEYEKAIDSVVSDYNTSIYENRFITGGAVEIFTLWAMRASGIEISQVSSQLRGADLQLPRGGRISVKSSFTSPPGDIRLINVQGESLETEWEEATIFILAGIGLVYADPMYLPHATRRTRDAIVLPWREIREHIERHENLMAEVQIPVKSKLTAGSKVASRAVALEVVQSLGLSRLRSGFPE